MTLPYHERTHDCGALRAADVGKTVRVVVFRDGTTQTFRITLGRREDAERAVPAVLETPEEPDEPAQKEVLGLTLSVLTEDLRAELGIPETAEGLVVVDVIETSEAFEKGLRPGDLITEAGQQKVSTLGEFDDRVAEAQDAGRKSLLLLVRRGGDPRFVALGLE